MMQDFKEDKVVNWLAGCPPAEAALCADLYEKAHGKSPKSALEAKCGKKFALGLSALLVAPGVPRPRRSSRDFGPWHRCSHRRLLGR